MQLPALRWLYPSLNLSFEIHQTRSLKIFYSFHMEIVFHFVSFS